VFLVEHKDENFGNGREVRNIFEQIISAQANRIVQSRNITDDDLTTIIEDDVNELVSKNSAFNMSLRNSI